MTTRIMLVDDHRLLRETLAAPLAAEADFAVVAQAGSGQQALALLAQVSPDILLLDIGLPDINGVEVARQALAIQPDLRIVALSGYEDRIFVDKMLKAGARGYVVKSAGIHELILAIRAVLGGHIFLSAEVTAAMLGPVSPPSPSAEPDVSPAMLGKKELDVLRYLAQGLRSNEIAEHMVIQSGTVDVHRRNIKRKLGVSTIAELTRYAIRTGLISV